MKILLTGATGLIGKTLTKELLACGYEVHFLTTQALKVDSLLGCKGFLWNVKTLSIDKNCITGVNVIIHLAGASISKRWTPAYKKEIITSRVDGAQLLHQLLQKNKHQVQQFITASGVGIYKDSFTEIYTEESNVFGNGFLAEVVQKWEQAADAFVQHDIKVLKIRTGVVLSGNDGALAKMSLPIKSGLGSVLGNGKQQMSWIHINDLVRLYVFVLQEETEGIVNAVAPEVITNTNFTKMLAMQLNTKIRMPNVPKMFLKFLLGEMHLLLCESQNVSSDKIQKLGFKFQYPTLKDTFTHLFIKR